VPKSKEPSLPDQPAPQPYRLATGSIHHSALLDETNLSIAFLHRLAMEQQQYHEKPPAYSHTDPDTIVLPSAPQHDPQAPIQLPDIKSLNLPEANRFLANGAQHTPQWQLPPAHSVFSPSRSDFPRPSIEVASPIDTASVMSYDGNAVRAGSVMSIDDPETRMAAEALSALGNLGIVTCNHSNLVLTPYQTSHAPPPPAP
jgi:hypothetical protein